MEITILCVIVGVVFCYLWGAGVNAVADGTSFKEGMEKEIDNVAKVSATGIAIQKGYDKINEETKQ